MAQAGWFMYQRWDGVAVGVFSTEENAKQAAVDGEYVLVPIEANQSYVGIDESLPGAIVYQADGFDTRLTAVETDLDNTKTQAQTKFAQIDAEIADLQARVVVLEGG